MVFVLDQLANNLPNGVWLTAIAQGSNKDADNFIVDGCAFSLGEVNEYYNGLLKTSGLSKDASLEIKSIVSSGNITMAGNSAVGKNKQIIIFEIITKAVDTTS